jgi:hypothetical protein
MSNNRPENRDTVADPTTRSRRSLAAHRVERFSPVGGTAGVQARSAPSPCPPSGETLVGMRFRLADLREARAISISPVCGF